MAKFEETSERLDPKKIKSLRTVMAMTPEYTFNEKKIDSESLYLLTWLNHISSAGSPKVTKVSSDHFSPHVNPNQIKLFLHQCLMMEMKLAEYKAGDPIPTKRDVEKILMGARALFNKQDSYGFFLRKGAEEIAEALEIQWRRPEKYDIPNLSIRRTTNHNEPISQERVTAFFKEGIEGHYLPAEPATQIPLVSALHQISDLFTTGITSYSNTYLKSGVSPFQAKVESDRLQLMIGAINPARWSDGPLPSKGEMEVILRNVYKILNDKDSQGIFLQGALEKTATLLDLENPKETGRQKREGRI